MNFNDTHIKTKLKKTTTKNGILINEFKKTNLTKLNKQITKQETKYKKAREW